MLKGEPGGGRTWLHDPARSKRRRSSLCTTARRQPQKAPPKYQTGYTPPKMTFEGLTRSVARGSAPRKQLLSIRGCRGGSPSPNQALNSLHSGSRVSTCVLLLQIFSRRKESRQVCLPAAPGPVCNLWLRTAETSVIGTLPGGPRAILRPSPSHTHPLPFTLLTRCLLALLLKLVRAANELIGVHTGRSFHVHGGSGEGRARQTGALHGGGPGRGEARCGARAGVGAPGTSSPPAPPPIAGAMPSPGPGAQALVSGTRSMTFSQVNTSGLSVRPKWP